MMKTSLIINSLLFFMLLALPANSKDDEFKVKLEFSLKAGRTYIYSVTSSRSVESDVPQPMMWQTDKQITKVLERTDQGTYLLETKMDKESKQRNVAIEYFRRNFPSYQVELTPDGYMTTPPRQPFPQVRNVPIFPSYEVGVGDKWIVEDVPFYPGGLIDEVTADWNYELVEFVKHNDFNTAHIKATATVNFNQRPVTLAFLGFFGDPANSEEGAYIKELVPGSPAEAAGLMVGDRVLTLDKVKITDWWDIPELIPYLLPGDEVSVEYERDGESKEITFTMGTTEIAQVAGHGTFNFDIYFGYKKGHIITLEGKSNDLTLDLQSDAGTEQKVITSSVLMEFLPEG